MTAKEYLRQLERKNTRIDALMERLQYYRDMAERRVAVYSHSPKSGARHTSSVETYVCKIVDLTAELDRRIDEYVNLTREIESTISWLADGRHRDILTWRYINGWSWKRIANEMGYELRQVFRLHGFALLEFTKVSPARLDSMKRCQ